MSPTEAEMIHFYAGLVVGFGSLLGLLLFMSWFGSGCHSGYQPTTGNIDRSNPPKGGSGAR